MREKTRQIVSSDGRRWNPAGLSLMALTLVAMLSLVACGGGGHEADDSGTSSGEAEGSSATPAASGGPLPLPEFTACSATEAPTLPAKWQSSALLQDFVQDNLWFGNFVYDEDAQAFRYTLASRYGQRVDQLTTTDGRLYELVGGGDLPTSCQLLTDSSPFTVPSRQWVGDGGKCVGEAPILERNQEWWKNPSGDVGANWFWFNASDRLPFRNMYYEKPTEPAPVYEHFTFNYLPNFEGVSSTNLAEIVALCEGQGGGANAAERYAEVSAAPILAGSSFPTVDLAHIDEIHSWIPGLSECPSDQTLPPAWPEQVQFTAFMTAVSFAPNPFPTRVYYDWTRSPKAQNSTLFVYPTDPENFSQTALLTGTTGYGYGSNEAGEVTSCDQSMPGPQVPNWKVVDGCECRGQLAPGSVLNPSSVPTNILWCPTDLSAKQVFWTWYSDLGEPVVFMQSNSSPTAGTGLNLADYYEWAPGSVAPSGTYDIPTMCEGTEPIAVPQACHNCHLPLNEDRAGG